MDRYSDVQDVFNDYSNIIELFASGAITSLGSVLFSNVGFFLKGWGKLFEELQGLNSEFKLITPKSNTGTYFGNMVAILDTF